jgi:aminoglycoside 3-N-acetyltransferase I
MNQIEIRKLTNQDISAFKALLLLFNQAFEEERDLSTTEHLSALLNNRQFVVMAAFSGEEILGGLTAYELPLYYENKAEIFLYDMAVHPEHQRKGVGKQLLGFLKAYCAKNKISTFFVLAHEEDVHALKFYKSTGGEREQVANFIYEIE